MESQMQTPFQGSGQATPLADGLKSPESVQWGTPVETPNTAWGRKDTPEPLETDEVSDEDTMEEDIGDPNCPRIPVTKAEKERLRRPWRQSLILRVLGRKVSYSYLLQRLKTMWKPEANFDLIALDQDYFVAKFESRRDYEFAKFEGPWIVLGHYVIVQEWEPNFHPYKNKVKKLLVWARLPAIPIEYFEDDFLAKIGNQIGRPVRIDTTTSLVSIGKFARICVEVDLSKPLLSKFTLEDEVLPIEYEGIHMVCFTCGIFGNKQGHCGLGETETVNADSTTGGGQVTQPALGQQSTPRREFKGNFGAWMLVARKERRGPRRNVNGPPDRRNTGNK